MRPHATTPAWAPNAPMLAAGIAQSCTATLWWWMVAKRGGEGGWWGAARRGLALCCGPRPGYLNLWPGIHTFSPVLLSAGGQRIRPDCQDGAGSPPCAGGCQGPGPAVRAAAPRQAHGRLHAADVAHLATAAGGVYTDLVRRVPMAVLLKLQHPRCIHLQARQEQPAKRRCMRRGPHGAECHASVQASQIAKYGCIRCVHHHCNDVRVALAWAGVCAGGGGAACTLATCIPSPSSTCPPLPPTTPIPLILHVSPHPTPPSHLP